LFHGESHSCWPFWPQAALATSASQYTCAGLLLWALHRKRLLQTRHLRSPPSLRTIAPLLRACPA